MDGNYRKVKEVPRSPDSTAGRSSVHSKRRSRKGIRRPGFKCACGRAKWLGGLATEVAGGTAIADCLSIDISGDFDGGPSSPVEIAECPSPRRRLHSCLENGLFPVYAWQRMDYEQHRQTSMRRSRDSCRFV
jgi:hypothetical protein